MSVSNVVTSLPNLQKDFSSDFTLMWENSFLSHAVRAEEGGVKGEGSVGYEKFAQV